MAKHKSPFSVGRRQTVLVASDDPRNKNGGRLENYRSKLGADIIVKNISSPKKLQEGTILDYWIQTTEYSSIPYYQKIVSNNLYVWLVESTGTYLSTNKSIKISKLRYDGTVVWQKLLTDATSLIPYDAKVDSSGNLYIGGSAGSTGIVGNKRYYGYLCKINNSGAVIWENIADITWDYATGDQHINAIDFDSSGNIYATLVSVYYPTGPTSVIQLNVVKYNSSGSNIWYKSISYSGVLWPNSIKVNSNNDIYLVGSDGVNKAYIAKIDPNGSISWQKLISNYYMNGYFNVPTEIDSYNNLWIGLESYDSGYYRPSLIQLDSNGNILFTKCYPGDENGSKIRDFVVDSNNEIYFITDSFNQAVQAGETTHSRITKLDNTYTRNWIRSFTSSSSYQYISSIAMGVESLISNTFATVQKLPKDGTKTGTYTVGSNGVTYSIVPLSGIEVTQSYTVTTPTYIIQTTPNFSSSSYSTTVTESTYVPAITKF